MRTKLTIALATAAVAGSGATATAATAPSAATTAGTRHVEGRVTAVDRSARTFTIRDAERGRLKVKVTARTKFERIRFSSLRTGSRVDVRATRVSGAWVATKVERGDAIGANHDAGDDHGGRHGGGNDDPAGHN